MTPARDRTEIMLTPSEAIDRLRSVCLCYIVCSGYGETCPTAKEMIVLMRRLQMHEHRKEDSDHE